jgi:hypothetical protein
MRPSCFVVRRKERMGCTESKKMGQFYSEWNTTGRGSRCRFIFFVLRCARSLTNSVPLGVGKFQLWMGLFGSELRGSRNPRTMSSWNTPPSRMYISEVR